ncbi:XRE family transcriptional regulator [Aquitalea sp. LB_tupeE]|nr:XRE family transcriptional regulator [Aquitalea sp. LB_tupeE]
MRAVAGRLGYSVATVSLVLAGKYPGKTDKIAHASMQALDSVRCPRLQRSLTIQECRAVALAPIPMHHPLKLGHWRACQHCPQRPEGDAP